MERAFAAEFPNDNDELHLGAIWRNDAPCGPPVAHPPVHVLDPVPVPVLVPGPVALELALGPDAELPLDEDDEPIEIVDSLDIEDPVEVVPAPLESAVVLSSHAALAFVEAMDIPPPPRLPSELGAPEPTLAIAEAPEPPAPAEDPYVAFLRVLVDAAEACGGAIGAATLEAAWAGDPVAAAWRAILRSESEDFALCTTTLDEWASNALAAILGAPSKAAALRRELRARGVAAFGMVLDAA